MPRFSSVLSLFVFVTFLVSCSKEPRALKVYGKKELINGDSVYVKIPTFEFTDQDAQPVNNQLFRNKIYVTDFFFTTCPTICPRMKSQMKRIYDAFYDNPDILILSHSIDPVHDSVEVLKEFADKLEIKAAKWHMVTGEKSEIYGIAKSYMVSAAEDPRAPGGYVHSGAFILMDREGRIRGYYDGTDPLVVNQLIDDIRLLLTENENQ